MYKVLIRPLELEDASFSWKWRNDPDIWKYTGRKPDIVVTEEVEKQWLLEKISENNSARFAIIVDDEYVGNIQLTNIIENESAEYHIFIGDKTYWGKGVARLATNQIICYAKNLLNLREIYLFVNPDNIAAIKVYERAGFNKVNDNIKMILSLSETPAPCVSVFMLAYNHEKYIAEAIESVLMQKTNFDFEIVIGEDYSTDNTRQIILGYQKKYPGKFKLLLHEKNIGAMANQMAVFGACTGKYIAMCEGDDYWTDPLKLQKQVDFLEANEKVIAISTNSSVCDLNGNTLLGEKVVITPDNKEGIYNLHDFFNRKFQYSTNTVVFRNLNMDFITKEMQRMSNPFLGDWILWVLLHMQDDFCFINNVTAAYRINPNSITHTVNAVKRWEWDFVIRRHLMQILPKEYHVYLKDSWYPYFKLGMAHRKKGNYTKLLYYFIRAFLYNPVSFSKNLISIKNKE